MLVVGALALTAVAVVAVSVRLGTRVEFDRFQNIEHTEDARIRSVIDAIVTALDGRCCDESSMAAAKTALESGEPCLCSRQAARMSRRLAAMRISPA